MDLNSELKIKKRSPGKHKCQLVYTRVDLGIIFGKIPFWVAWIVASNEYLLYFSSQHSRWAQQFKRIYSANLTIGLVSWDKLAYVTWIIAKYKIMSILNQEYMEHWIKTKNYMEVALALVKLFLEPSTLKTQTWDNTISKMQFFGPTGMFSRTIHRWGWFHGFYSLALHLWNNF